MSAVGRHGWYIVAAYVAGRAWQLMMIGPPVWTADASGYRVPVDGWFNFDAVSLAGNAMRPWPMTLLYATGPSDNGRVLLQFAVATVCWSALVLVTARGLGQGWPSTGGAITVLIIALSAPVSHWDAVLLAESLLISSGALFVAAVVALTNHGSLRLWAFAFVVSGGFLIVVRPVLLPLVAAGTAMLAVRSTAASRAAVLSVVVALTAVSVHAWWLNARIDRHWGAYVGMTEMNGRTVQQFAILLASPHGERLLDAAIADGAPACLRPFDDAAYEWWRARVADCPTGVRWMSDESTTWFLGYLASSPSFLRAYLREGLREQSLARDDGIPSLPSPVPSSLAALFFGDGRAVDPMAGWGIVVVAVAAGAIGRTRGTISMRLKRASLSRGGAYMALAGGSQAALIVTVLFSALDISRVGVSAAIPLRVGLVLSLFTLLPRLGPDVPQENGAVGVAPLP